MDGNHLHEPASLRLESNPQASGAARRFLRERLARSNLDGVGDTIELLTSELVTNVVQHVGSPMTVRVLRNASSVRVEVDDESTVTPTLTPPGALSQYGRGMWLVDRLAAQWGTRTRDGGKTVWFTVETRVDDPPGDPRASSSEVASDQLLA
jgi:anti-sigma regulatory factor (Ser/Thr protein kinase)